MTRLLHRASPRHPAGPSSSGDRIGDPSRNLERAPAIQRRAARRIIETQRDERRELETALYDGPGQHLAAALMALDGIRGRWHGPGRESAEGDLALLERALTGALEELRTLAAGLRTPHLAGRSVADVVERAVREHRENPSVELQTILGQLPVTLPPALKVALFNALRDVVGAMVAGGRRSTVSVVVGSRRGWLHVRVAAQAAATGAASNGVAAGAHPVHGDLTLARTRALTDLLGGILSTRRDAAGGLTVTMAWPILDRARP